MKQDLEDESLLISKAKKGDKAAFSSLVIKHQYKVFAAISRFTRDPSEVMDISQDTFVRAYKSLNRFRGDCSFYTWLYRIAINVAKNYITMQSRKVPSVDIEISDIERGIKSNKIERNNLEVPEYDLMNDEVHEILAHALDDLPEELKTALLLREVEGMTYNEISNIMNCPIGTVRSRIHRAKEVIEKRIDPLILND